MSRRYLDDRNRVGNVLVTCLYEFDHKNCRGSYVHRDWTIRDRIYKTRCSRPRGTQWKHTRLCLRQANFPSSTKKTFCMMGVAFFPPKFSRLPLFQSFLSRQSQTAEVLNFGDNCTPESGVEVASMSEFFHACVLSGFLGDDWRVMCEFLRCRGKNASTGFESNSLDGKQINSFDLASNPNHGG